MRVFKPLAAFCSKMKKKLTKKFDLVLRLIKFKTKSDTDLFWLIWT